MENNYEPTWVSEELHLPKDRQTLNAWARAFAALNPIVSSTIEFYSKIPLNFLTISETNHTEDRFWNEQKETVGLDVVLCGILNEIWTLGEAFVYLNMDELNRRWSEAQIQNPDYIIVKKNIDGKTSISLRPDERLRRAVLDGKTKEFKNINPEVISSIKDGKNIALNDFYVAHFATKLTPYEIRGSSPLLSVMRLLMLSDQLRAAKADKNEIKKIEKQIKQTIYYPHDEYNGIARDVISTRVLFVMSMLQGWLRAKFFAPIAKINEFYKYQDGAKILSVPTVHFDVVGFKEYLDLSWRS